MTEDRPRRRRPLSLTDRQLQSMALFVAWYIDDFSERDGMDVPRVREFAGKVDAELAWRSLDPPVIVGRDPIVGTPTAVIGPFRRR